MNVRLGKAGRRRWMGVRPTVRGMAMNPVDHPLGGGEGAGKGRNPVAGRWARVAARARGVVVGRVPAGGGRLAGSGGPDAQVVVGDEQGAQT